MRLQAKDFRQPLELEEAGIMPPWSLRRELGPAHTLASGLGENKCLLIQATSLWSLVRAAPGDKHPLTIAPETLGQAEAPEST